LISLGAAAGCETAPRTTAAQALVSPYDTVGGEPLWAVVPPQNDSGTSLVDPLAVGDEVVAQIAQVRGLTALPLNRTISAMRTLGLDAVRSPGEADALARALGADGVVMGSITAYDPYRPPVFGLTLVVHSRPGLGRSGGGFEVRRLQMSPTEFGDAMRSAFGGRPVSVSSLYLDARDGAVRSRLRAYAEGRTDPGSALGWREYEASIDLYTRFAAHEAVRGLLNEEWLRLSRAQAAQPAR